MHFELTSRPLEFEHTGDDTPSDELLGRLRVFESHEPAPSNEGTGSYRVHITAEVETRSQFYELREEAWDLAKGLDRMWIYATGRALSAPRIGFKVAEAPDGWIGNGAEVERWLSATSHELNLSAHFENRHWMVAREYPLRLALQALRAYQAISGPLRTLVEFHYQAERMRGNAAELLLLAKGLELARDLAGAPTQQHYACEVDAELGKDLCRDVGWLFRVANKRLETRHAVANKQGPQLHPEMSPEERSHFRSDARVVLRWTVARELGIRFVGIRESA